MAENIKCQFLAQVAGGPLLSAASELQVEGYDKLSFTLKPKGASSVPVAPKTSQLLLVVVIASPYPAPGQNLSYTTSDGNNIPLDAPHIFMGAGAIKLLGSLEKVDFSNETDKDVLIEILIGRQSTQAKAEKGVGKTADT